MTDLVLAIEEMLDPLIDGPQQRAKVDPIKIVGIKLLCRQRLMWRFRIRHQLTEGKAAAERRVEQRDRPVRGVHGGDDVQVGRDRSEEHTSELQSLMRNSYAVFCLK